MADLSINFRIGGSRQSIADPRGTFLTDRVVEVLRRAAEQKGVERVYQAVVDQQGQILEDIRKDAERFAAAAARVFTKVQSTSVTGVSISLDDVSRRSAVYSTDSMSKRLQGKTTVEWVGLTHVTVQNKRCRMQASRRRRGAGTVASAGEPTTFFVDTGALRKLLIDHLGPAMGMLVDPKLVVRKGPRKVSVTLSILTQASGKEKAGVTGQSFPGVSGGGAIAESEALFVRYLKRAGAADRDPKHPLSAKLENPRGKHRPFLQNMLAYWISRRLPIVLDKSLRSALAKRTKEVK